MVAIVPDNREQRGRSRRGAGRPTIANVAQLAGVSAITVSRALRDPHRVSPELRSQIQEAIGSLGYVPDTNARALASATANTIAVLVPSLTNNVFADVVCGIYDGLNNRSFHIQLGNTHYSGVEEERLLRVFIGQRPSALIISGIDQLPQTRRLLENADCPIVQIMETTADPIDMLIGFSHFDSGFAATQHLLDEGYRRIGFIGARMDPRSHRRLAGYRRALEKADLFDPDLINTTSLASGVALGGHLFREAKRRAATLDAVFCNNDDLALGVLFECNRSSIEIPKEMGLCGFNDLEMMEVAFPSISSVRTPRYEIGQRAVEMALSRLAGDPVSSPVVDVGFELRPRESSARSAV